MNGSSDSEMSELHLAPPPLLTQSNEKLSSFQPDGQYHVIICWKNTNETFLKRVSAAELRFACPCAGCNDLHGTFRAKTKLLKPEDIEKNIRILKVDKIGQYALRLFFSDKHSEGIYTFSDLISLCKTLTH